MLRLVTSMTPSVLCFGAYTLDPLTRELLLADRPVRLTRLEFELLQLFADHPGRLYTPRQLLDLIWKSGERTSEHAVKAHISRLRAKLDRGDPRSYIETVWGVGYRFNGHCLK